MPASRSRGKQELLLQKRLFSEEKENDIKTKYEALDKHINGNDELLEQINCCKALILHAQ